MGGFLRSFSTSAVTVQDDLINKLATPSITPTLWADKMYVAVHWYSTPATTYTVTADYNGTPMTSVGSVGTSPFVDVFELDTPARGTNTLTITWVNASGSTTIVARISVLFVSGVKTTRGIATGTGSSSTPSITIGAAGNTADLKIGFFTVNLSGGTTTATVGTGDTSQGNITFGSGATLQRLLCSTQDMGGDGVLDWTLAASKPWVGLVLAGKSDGRLETICNGCLS